MSLSIQVAFASSPLPTWILEQSTLSILDANDAASQLLGIPHGELITSSAATFMPTPPREESGWCSGAAAMRTKVLHGTANRRTGPPVPMRFHLAQACMAGMPVWIVTGVELAPADDEVLPACSVAWWTADPALLHRTPAGQQHGQASAGDAPAAGPAERFTEAVHPEDRDRVQELLAGALPGSAFDFECRVVDGRGRHRHVVETGIRIPEGTRPGAGWAGCSVDLTRWHRSLEALQEQARAWAAANARLVQTAMDRDRFLAWTSHELRTPLASILTLCELALTPDTGTPAPTHHRQIGQIQECAQHLHTLINDLLELARLNATPDQPVLQPCSARQIAAESLEMVGPKARREGVDLGPLTTGQGISVVADPLRLKQVLVNLLANAVKSTRPGGRVELAVHRAGPGWIRFDVADTGSGIPREKLAEIFQPFVQLAPDPSRPEAGTGLGLAIVKYYVEQQRGSISIRSEPGRGTVFSVLLPQHSDAGSTEPARTPQHAQVPPSAPTEPLPAVPTPVRGTRPVRVLVVDDDELNRTLLSDLLADAGYVVAAVPDGPSALREFERHDPDVVIMDVQMPGVDGLEVTRRIRALKDPRHASVPVLGLTALGMPGDRKRCLDAGMTDYYVKPFPLSRFPALINRLVSSRTSPVTTA